jgi:hypothetical protein
MKTEIQKPPATRVDCLDGLQDCFETVTTLAGLLEAIGKNPRSELVKPELVSHAGAMILAEMERAQAWLDKLDESEAR